MVMYNANYNGYQASSAVKPAPMAPLPQIGLKGRPVSSLDEVRAAQIDFDGSIFVFPDFANKRIYTKQINLDGTASLNMYCLTEIPTLESQYVTKEEFDNTLGDIKTALTQLAAAQEQAHAQATPPEDEFRF